MKIYGNKFVLCKINKYPYIVIGKIIDVFADSIFIYFFNNKKTVNFWKKNKKPVSSPQNLKLIT